MAERLCAALTAKLGLGYYNYNKKYNAYFEILSYDKILNDAKKRNRVLFDKLGLVQ